MKVIIIILLTVLLSCQSAVPPPIEVEPVPVDRTEVAQVDQATGIWFGIIWVGIFSSLFISLHEYQRLVLK